MEATKLLQLHNIAAYPCSKCWNPEWFPMQKLKEEILVENTGGRRVTEKQIDTGAVVG